MKGCFSLGACCPAFASLCGQNERGISALGVAVGFNRKAAVELLLDAGADLSLRDAGDNTVLHYAAGVWSWA